MPRKKFPGQPRSLVFYYPAAAAVGTVLHYFDLAVGAAGVTAVLFIEPGEIAAADIFIDIHGSNQFPLPPVRIDTQAQDRVPYVDGISAGAVLETDEIFTVFLVKIVANDRSILIVDHFAETPSGNPELFFSGTQEPFRGNLVRTVGQNGAGTVKSRMVKPAVIGMDDTLA
jgi:hypothetical protein